MHTIFLCFFLGAAAAESVTAPVVHIGRGTQPLYEAAQGKYRPAYVTSGTSRLRKENHHTAAIYGNSRDQAHSYVLGYPAEKPEHGTLATPRKAAETTSASKGRFETSPDNGLRPAIYVAPPHWPSSSGAHGAYPVIYRNAVPTRLVRRENEHAGYQFSYGKLPGYSPLPIPAPQDHYNIPTGITTGSLQSGARYLPSATDTAHAAVSHFGTQIPEFSTGPSHARSYATSLAGGQYIDSLSSPQTSYAVPIQGSQRAQPESHFQNQPSYPHSYGTPASSIPNVPHVQRPSFVPTVKPGAPQNALPSPYYPVGVTTGHHNVPLVEPSVDAGSVHQPPVHSARISGFPLPVPSAAPLRNGQQYYGQSALLANHIPRFPYAIPSNTNQAASSYLGPEAPGNQLTGAVHNPASGPSFYHNEAQPFIYQSGPQPAVEAPYNPGYHHQARTEYGLTFPSLHADTAGYGAPGSSIYGLPMYTVGSPAAGKYVQPAPHGYGVPQGAAFLYAPQTSSHKFGGGQLASASSAVFPASLYAVGSEVQNGPSEYGVTYQEK